MGQQEFSIGGVTMGESSITSRHQLSLPAAEGLRAFVRLNTEFAGQDIAQIRETEDLATRLIDERPSVDLRDSKQLQIEYPKQ